MIQLYQAEWCPFSKIVRQRLSELGVDYVTRQVAPFPEDRDALREATGHDSIPVAVLEDGTVLGGDTREILEAIEALHEPGPWEEGHREQEARH
jgi:glutathione S-transferase